MAAWGPGGTSLAAGGIWRSSGTGQGAPLCTQGTTQQAENEEARPQLPWQVGARTGARRLRQHQAASEGPGQLA